MNTEQRKFLVDALGEDRVKLLDAKLLNVREAIKAKTMLPDRMDNVLDLVVSRQKSLEVHEALIEAIKLMLNKIETERALVAAGNGPSATVYKSNGKGY